MAKVSARAGTGLGVVVLLALNGTAVAARVGGGDRRVAGVAAARVASLRSSGLDDDGEPEPGRPPGEPPTTTAPARTSTSTSAPRSTTTSRPPDRTTSTTTGAGGTPPPTTVAGQKVDAVGIYVVGVDGTGLRRVSNEEGMFTWSPDGRRLAYANGHGLMIVGADGSGRTSVAAAGTGVLAPAWAPDGTRLAFTRSGGGAYIVPVDGSAPATLVDPLGQLVAWTPDGRLAVINPEQVGVPTSLSLYDRDGTRRVLARGASQYLQPAPSPDGRSVAYLTDRLMVVGVDGSAPRALTGACCAVESVGSPLHWSPDSRQLAYIDHGDVWVVDVSGGDRLAVPGATNPAWSPDGTRLAVTDEQEVRPGGRLRMSLQVVGVDGTDRHVVLDPGDLVVMSPQWSPDGRHIAVVAVPGVLPLPPPP